jgi:hypothetical protein
MHAQPPEEEFILSLLLKTAKTTREAVQIYSPAHALNMLVAGRFCRLCIIFTNQYHSGSLSLCK